MWNSEAPLKLLQSLPAKLDIESLRIIQKVIDDDKYINSKIRDRDLCGQYAPFCANYCDKGIIKYPCAVAYVKMKQAEGMQVEIAATEEELAVEEEPEVVDEPVAVEEPVPVAVEESAEYTDKKYIRIATAKYRR